MVNLSDNNDQFLVDIDAQFKEVLVLRTSYKVAFAVIFLDFKRHIELENVVAGKQRLMSFRNRLGHTTKR